jgi:hypothetical protein
VTIGLHKAVHVLGTGTICVGIIFVLGTNCFGAFCAKNNLCRKQNRRKHFFDCNKKEFKNIVEVAGCVQLCIVVFH